MIKPTGQSWADQNIIVNKDDLKAFIKAERKEAFQEGHEIGYGKGRVDWRACKKQSLAAVESFAEKVKKLLVKTSRQEGLSAKSEMANAKSVKARNNVKSKSTGYLTKKHAIRVLESLFQAIDQLVEEEREK